MGKIIGVMGQARSGKDTTAEYLAKKYGYVRVGLADPMKRFCKQVFDFSDEQLYGNERDEADTRYLQKSEWRTGPEGVPVKKDTYLTPRYALQTLGTEWGRNCYDSIWVDYGIRVAQSLLADKCLAYSPSKGVYRKATIAMEDIERWGGPVMAYRGAVFSDLRFKNEFDAVKKAGGIMIRIKRPGFDGNVGAQNHASEMEQKSLPDSAFDEILDNSGSFEHLYKQIDSIASAI